MTVDTIMKESLLLFAQHGYENTSLAMISERVGIKKPSLYNHFKNKEDIFTRVLKNVACAEITFIEEIEDINESIKDNLFHLYKSYLDHMATSNEGLFFKRVTFFPPAEFAEHIQQVFLDVEERLTKKLVPILQEGITRGQIKDLPIDRMTSAFYTLIDGLFLEEHFYPSDVFEQRKQASWEIFWLGIHQE